MKKLPIIPTIIASGLGSGFAPIAPGTAGAILATIIWFVLSHIITPSALIVFTALAIVISTIIGTWATKKLEPFWGEDPSKVVIDEMIGVWIPLIIVKPQDLWFALVALILFRIFDIIKPFGIRKLDQKQGAFWVMADDIVAGIYSLIILFFIQWLV